MIRGIKRIFGIYEPGYEYWVYLKDIKVPIKYKESRIKREKWLRKLAHWRRTGEFESEILLHRDFSLVDGYSTVKICYINNIEKVPVYFVD